MPVLTASEYDIRYFDGKKATYRHNAGYSQYERWRRFDGKDSLGEYWKDKARGLLDAYALAGKKVLEIGCAKGFVVEDLRSMGVDCYGLDVSTYAVNEASVDVWPYLTIGDARTYLVNYSNNEFDVVFSLRTLECFSDAELLPLIKEMNRISKFQFHEIDEFVGYPEKQGAAQYYNSKTLEDWLAMGFSKNTKLTSRENSQKVLTK